MEKALGKVPVNIKTVNDGSSEFIPIGENQVIPMNLLNDNNRLAKLITLLDAIETIETAVDGSIRIIYKSNVITEARGDIIRHTKTGCIIDKAAIWHVNPITMEDIPVKAQKSLKHINANIKDN